MLDVTKAYEYMRYDVLQAKALASGFNGLLLRLLLALYASARHLVVDGVAAASCTAWRAVVPGCPFADLCMRIYLTDIVDLSIACWPSTKIAVVVDDVQGIASGRPRDVASAIVGAFRSVRNGLQRDGLACAPAKFVFMTNSTEVVDEVRRREPLLAATLAGSARNLGIDFVVSVRRQKAAVQQKRWKEVRKRASKVKSLRRKGASVSKLVRQSLLPAGRYGVGVSGATDGALKHGPPCTVRSLKTWQDAQEP